MIRFRPETRSFLLAVCGYSLAIAVLIYVFVHRSIGSALRGAIGWAALMFVYAVVRSISQNRRRPS